MRQRLLPLSSLFALALAAPAFAQTGDFADGELLVRTRDPLTLDYNIYRIDPTTGNGAVFLPDVTLTSVQTGWYVYDAYRDGMLAYTPHLPLKIQNSELLLVRGDGQVAQLGFRLEQLSAMAPVGDGRVYLSKGGELHLLDAANDITPVLDAGGQPVDLPFSFLIYDAPSNALLGAIGTGTPGALCGSTSVSVTRLPLNATGTQLSGAPTCNGYGAASGTGVIGLDHLPSGEILLTQRDNDLIDKQQLRSFDPVTLAFSPWAESNVSDLDGGAWTQPLGKAVVLDDVNNVLRAYGFGESGTGTEIPTTVPVSESSTGGGSNTLVGVNGGSGACPGSVSSFGQGVPGFNNWTPLLGAGSCPKIGSPLPIHIGNGRPAGAGLMGFSLNTTTYPLGAGMGYLAPPLLFTAPFTLSSFPQDGLGKVVVPISDDPGLIGITVYVQAGIVDSVAAGGFSLSQALAITIG
ncbi:MAG: hypothetical protein AAF682_12990 [Planctomycetota bacterium]